MKIRNGYVSNSSSSSFILSMSKLSEYQIDQIKRHGELNCLNDYDTWNVKEIDGNLKLSTWMDNFDMEEYLLKIGINEEDIQWNEYGAW